MKKHTRILSLVLSAAMLLGAMPGWASAAAEVKTVLPNTHHDGGFQIGTYGDVAAVWENVYYNPATGDMVKDLDDIDPTTDTHSLNWAAYESDVPSISVEEPGGTRIEFPSSGDGGTSDSDNETYANDRRRYPAGYNTEEEADPNRPNEWFWRPMYLVRADEKGLHRISDYYAELTGISETGHVGAKGFCGRWGAIDSKGNVVYDFEYESITEMEGYVEPRTTRNTSTRNRPGYMTQPEDHSHMLIVITEESEKLRAYHNGYVITQRGDG